jgi:type IV pilus assembly protein PilM
MGILKRNKPADSVVGLELDPGHIAAAQVSVNGSIKVERGGVAALAPGLLRDGEVTNPAALAEALSSLFDQNELPRVVRLGIANQRIVVRSLHVPVVAEGELEELVRSQAADHFPMPMDEAVLDFQSLGTVDTPEGPRTRVLVVAARRETVERLFAACDAAGLSVAGIDLSAFAMVRALWRSGSDDATLFVSAAGLINVAVAGESGCRFTRAAPGGLEEIAQTLADRRGLTLEHAHQWLRHVGLTTPLEQIEGDAELVADARAALEEGVHQLADTVRNSLNFFRMQETAERVERGVVVGPAVAIDGFVQRLSEQLGLPLEPGLLPVAEGLDASGSLTVAAGLAVGDRA